MFYYHVIFSKGPERTPVSLAATEASTGPLRAVIWTPRVPRWAYDPRTAANLLYDPRNLDRIQEVDRVSAENIARTLTTDPLPDETELRQIIEAGEKHPKTPPR